MIVARTERLVIRSFETRDVEAMMSVWGDTEVMRFSQGVMARPQVKSVIESCIDGDPSLSLWALELPLAGRVIGYCGLERHDDIGGSPEIEVGYRLARKWWGQGLATEAAAAVCDHAFGNLKLPRLVALIDPDNLASINVVRKLGFHYDKDAWLPGYDHPDHLYARSRREVGDSP